MVLCFVLWNLLDDGFVLVKRFWTGTPRILHVTVGFILAISALFFCENVFAGKIQGKSILVFEPLSAKDLSNGALGKF